MRNGIIVEIPKRGKAKSSFYENFGEAKSVFKETVAGEPKGLEAIELWSSGSGRVKRKTYGLKVINTDPPTHLEEQEDDESEAGEVEESEEVESAEHDATDPEDVSEEQSDKTES